MKRNLILISMLVPAMLSAGNRLRNSSFELGDAHFGSVRCSEITGTEIPYPGPAFEIDSTTATQGKNSLKLDLKKSEESVCWRFTTHEFDLEPGKTYTFSFDAKSEVPGGRISFACCSSQHYWQWHSSKTFTLAGEWKRYSMKVQIPPLKKGRTKYNEKYWMVLKTVKDSVQEVLRNPEDYRHRAAIMWASSLSHNDLTECGTEKDFACHKLEHELSGLFGVTHVAGLAAIWGSWARYVMDRHVSRFVKFAVNVMGVTNDFTNPLSTAVKGIEATERFFSSIGMPTSIPKLIGRRATGEEIDEMVRKCSRDGKMKIGAMEVLAPVDMVKIYRAANE